MMLSACENGEGESNAVWVTGIRGKEWINEVQSTTIRKF